MLDLLLICLELAVVAVVVIALGLGYLFGSRAGYREGYRAAAMPTVEAPRHRRQPQHGQLALGATSDETVPDIMRDGPL